LPETRNSHFAIEFLGYVLTTILIQARSQRMGSTVQKEICRAS